MNSMPASGKAYQESVKIGPPPYRKTILDKPIVISTFLVDVTEAFVLGWNTELLVKAGGEALAVGLSRIEISSGTTVRMLHRRSRVCRQAGERRKTHSL
jgi:hypothetical protein